MASQAPTFATPISSRIRPPDIEDHRRFVRIDHVPVIDVHRRTIFRKDEYGRKVPVEEELDERQLHRICENSRYRSSKGEYGIVFLGHTDDAGKETDQPPIVGYLSNYEVGTHNGRPTIVASMYLDRDSHPSGIVRQYPRRSAEIIGLAKEDGFIDALALLKRTPERDLGLVSHYALGGYGLSRFRSNRKVYRYQCPSCREEEGESSMPMMVTDPRQDKHKAKRGIATDALKLLKGLIFHVLDDEFNEGPSGHEHGPSGEEFEEELEDELEEDELEEDEEEGEHSYPSGPSGPSYPSEPSRHRRLDPSMGNPSGMPSGPSGPSSPSMPLPSGPSGPSYPSGPSLPSGASGPSQPSRQHRHRLDPSVQPHHHTSRYSEGEAETSESADPPPAPARGKPSRHSAGFPGPMSVTTPKAASGKARSATNYAGPIPKGKRGHRHGHHSSHGAPSGGSRTADQYGQHSQHSRMRRDQEAISVSRYRREMEVYRQENESLKSRLDALDTERREARIEQRVMQLEYEGYELDRPREVSRFMKLTDDEVTQEIEHIRKFYRQSPVGQPMIPGLEGDLRANDPASRVPSRFSLASVMEPGEEDSIPGQLGGSGSDTTHIWGLSALKDPDLKLDSSDSPVDRAMKTVERFRVRNGERKTK
jgi:hypothetical protein